MPTGDTSQLKEKILYSIRRRGPSLPVHVAKDAGISMLFASAFLSELYSDKKIILSNLRIGSSPLYLLEEQKPLLERFSNYLKSKERDAYLLLKEKQILIDKEQEPAIRVALRAIKDFAIPFQKNEEIYWRYFLVKENEIEVPKEKVEIKEEKKENSIKEEKPTEVRTMKIVPVKEEKKIEEPKKEEKQEKISEEKKQTFPKKLSPSKTPASKKTSKAGKKQDEEFLERVKGFLSKSSVAIANIESFGRGEITLRIKVHGKEQILVCYNKKKLTEKDIIDAAKKAKELDLKYSILSLSGLPKKFSELIDALKNLEEIEKIE